MNFKFGINFLELRSCNKQLLTIGLHDRAEIVKKENGYCYTLACWDKDKDGYNLRFIGDRPFDVNIKDFMFLAKQGQSILDEYFNNQ